MTNNIEFKKIMIMGYIKPSLICYEIDQVTFHGIAQKSQEAEHLKISVFHLV